MNTKQKIAFGLTAVVLGMMITYGCKKENEGTTSTTSVNTTAVATPSFAKNVLPIFQANCASSSCHGGSRSPTLNAYSGISSNASKCLSEIQSGSMPPGGKLSDADITTIQNWISQGKPNN